MLIRPFCDLIVIHSTSVKPYQTLTKLLLMDVRTPYFWTLTRSTWVGVQNCKNLEKGISFLIFWKSAYLPYNYRKLLLQWKVESIAGLLDVAIFQSVSKSAHS